VKNVFHILKFFKILVRDAMLRCCDAAMLRCWPIKISNIFSNFAQNPGIQDAGRVEMLGF